MDVLAVLAREAGQVVSKERLIDEVWPTQIVAESSLMRAIRQLRRAFGEDAGECRYVETIRKRGYRLVAPVERADDELASVTTRYSVELGDRRIPLSAGDNLIGRGVDAAVHIDCRDASRRHASILVTDDRAVLRDLGSKNGTFLWDQPVEGPSVLRDGDRIDIGPVTLIFRTSSATDTTSTWQAD
jgi:hypothetical protein